MDASDGGSDEGAGGGLPMAVVAGGAVGGLVFLIVCVCLVRRCCGGRQRESLTFMYTYGGGRIPKYDANEHDVDAFDATNTHDAHDAGANAADRPRHYTSFVRPRLSVDESPESADVKRGVSLREQGTGYATLSPYEDVLCSMGPFAVESH